MDKKGYTLVELLVSILIASILVITMGAISSISLSSYKEVGDEASIYNDVMNAFKFMQNRIHTAKLLTSEYGSYPWEGYKIICNNSAFGIYGSYGSGYGSYVKEFVYLPDKDDEANREVLLSVPVSAGDDDDLILFAYMGGYGGYAECYYGNYINLTGEKEGVPFNLKTCVTKRMGL